MACDKLKALSNAYRDVLRLDGFPVAVKFLKILEGFEKIWRPKSPLALCQLISEARYRHQTNLATADEMGLCWGGLAVTGIAEVPVDVKEGRRYLGWMHLTEEVSKKTIEALPKFKAGTYKGVLISPLDACPTEPDVVLFFGNASQMLVLCAGYLYNKGGSLTFKTAGLVGCAYAVVEPIQTGKPSLVVPCNGMRLLALPSDTDLAFGVPIEALEELLEGAKFLRERGGPAIPTAWQHISWKVEPPLLYITDPKGPGPIWLKSKKFSEEK
ncbi:MAG: DUF169 domain-containing protein [Thermoproteota archaeon]